MEFGLVKKRYFGLILALILTLLAYFNTLDNQLLWDDGYFIGPKTYEQTKESVAQAIRGIVPMSYGQIYRPVRGLHYSLANYLFQGEAIYYHIQALSIYLGIVMLVWLIAERLFPNNWMVATTSAILFGLHPLHTEAVTFMTASFDTMGILFFFMAFYLYLDPAQKKRRLYPLFALLAFFTYELTFVLLPLIVLYEWLIIKKPIIKAIQSPKQLWLLLFLYMCLRVFLNLHSESRPYIFGSFIQTLLFVPVLLFNYLKLMVFPYPLSINHEVYPGLTNLWYEDTLLTQLRLNVTAPIYLVSITTLACLIAGVKFFYKKGPWISFFLLWSVLCLVPVVGLIPQNSVFAERYGFIASFGLVMIVALVIDKLASSRPLIAVSLLLAITASFMVLSVRRNDVWQDMQSFWGHEEHLESNSAYITRQLAAGYYMDKDYHQAITLLEQALQQKPTADVYFKLGYLTALLGNCDRAEEYFLLSHQLLPLHTDAYNSLALCYLEAGREDKAYQLYTRSLTLNPQQPEVVGKLKELQHE
jgi:protein O-mannosyl-transferase